MFITCISRYLSMCNRKILVQWCDLAGRSIFYSSCRTQVSPQNSQWKDGNKSWRISCGLKGEHMYHIHTYTILTCMCTYTNTHRCTKAYVYIQYTQNTHITHTHTTSIHTHTHAHIHIHSHTQYTYTLQTLTHTMIIMKLFLKKTKYRSLELAHDLKQSDLTYCR